MLPSFAYVKAGSLSEAVKLLSSGNTVLHGGGSDLMGCLRERILTPSRVVSISSLEQLGAIRKGKDGGLAIGALATISEVAESKAIKKRYAGLAMAASRVASPQLRNQGTIGGNLCQKPRCWYFRGQFHCLRKGGEECFAAQGQNQYHAILGSDHTCYMVHPSDTAPALIVLNASVEIVGPQGKRRLPVEKLHVRPGTAVTRDTVLAPGEIITWVHLPPAPDGQVSTYRKVRARRSWDFALAGMALAAQMDGDLVKAARIAFSGVATVPWRAKQVEQVISGQKLDKALIAKAAQAAVAGAEPLEHNRYKVELLKAVVREELGALLG